jgi:ubiquinone/menaquinone biosynthesis C-methylase UbiE
MTQTDQESRHQIEREFHDQWADSIKIEDVNYKGAFESLTAIENRFALEQFGDIKGKRILDLGCGMGDATLYFASLGAQVDAVDISPRMIALVNRLASEYNFKDKIIAQVMVAEELNFSDNSFDFIFGNGVLHHVEYNKALSQVYKVLKKDGTAAFVEPLKHNPVINIYRQMADKVRTPTEQPFDYDQLSKLNNQGFASITHDEFHLLTLLVFVSFYLGEKVHPNNARYWKKIIDDAEKVKSLFNMLNNSDKLILKTIPFLRRYCWNTVIVCKK